MRSSVFSAADVAVVFVNGGKVGTTAFGASEEGLGTLAVRDGVAEAKASATLEKSGSVLKSADSGLAAKEIGRRALHQLEAIPVGVVEGEHYTGMVFAREVFFATEPSWFCKDSSPCADMIFQKFSAEDR
jgi:hypothetical protein